MWKTYVFFTYCIGSVGGTQLYIKSKRKYLEDLGWDIYIFSALDGPFLIPDLADKSFFIKELTLPISYYSSKKRKTILKRITGLLPKDCSQTIFESHNFDLATWAEIAAIPINAKHIVYQTSEIPQIPGHLRQFLKFKIDRKEYASITENCSKYIIDKYCTTSTNYPFLLAYGGHDCISDVHYNSHINSNYTIGVFGRLDKDYVCQSCFEIISFIRLHSASYFNIVYIGGENSPYNIIRKLLMASFRHVTNATLFFTGNIYPLPRCLVKTLNVCISGAGASVALCKEGVPTITINPITGYANGLLGVDTIETIYNRQHTKIQMLHLSNVLEYVYNNPDKSKPPHFELSVDFSKHLDFVYDSAQINKYDTSVYSDNSIKRLFYRIVLSLVPLSFLFQCKSLVNVFNSILKFIRIYLRQLTFRIHN